MTKAEGIVSLLPSFFPADLFISAPIGENSQTLYWYQSPARTNKNLLVSWLIYMNFPLAQQRTSVVYMKP